VRSQTTNGRARADRRVIKVGTLKRIHGITPHFYDRFAPAGIAIEVVPFEASRPRRWARCTASRWW
jgi:NitT/TauT family transport system substrate-binding protein